MMMSLLLFVDGIRTSKQTLQGGVQTLLLNVTEKG